MRFVALLISVFVTAVRAEEPFEHYTLDIPSTIYAHIEAGVGRSTAYCDSGCSNRPGIYGGGLGWQVLPWLAVEAGYLQSDTVSSASSRSDASFLTAAALFGWRISEIWGGFLRAGGAYYDVDVRYNRTSGIIRERTTGLSPHLGVGGFVNLNNNFALRLEISRVFGIGYGTNLGSSDADAITIGLTGHF